MRPLATRWLWLCVVVSTGCFVDQGEGFKPEVGDMPAGGKADEIDGGSDGTGGDADATDATPPADSDDAGAGTTGDPMAADGGTTGEDMGTTGDGPAAIDIVVNEVVCDPQGAGATDWFELVNLGDEPVDLGNYRVADTSNLFLIPPGTIIEPGEHLVFAEGEPGSFNFGLSKDGDMVELSDDSGMLVDSTAWGSGAAPAGTSWGRAPDGTGEFTQLPSPTPGSTNEG